MVLSNAFSLPISATASRADVRATLCAANGEAGEKADPEEKDKARMAAVTKFLVIMVQGGNGLLLRRNTEYIGVRCKYPRHFRLFGCAVVSRVVVCRRAVHQGSKERESGDSRDHRERQTVEGSNLRRPRKVRLFFSGSLYPKEWKKIWPQPLCWSDAKISLLYSVHISVSYLSSGWGSQTHTRTSKELV